MEWQQIIGFYQLVRLESFTKAAEATFRTQSALSQQLKALEEELGCLLIERIGNRKLRLTSKGEKFFRFAEEVLEKYESLTESLHDLQAIQRGTLSVAAPFTTLYHLFPEIFREYIAQYPQVQLSILDRPQKAVIELVKSGGVDFGFVLESVAPSNLVSWRWKKVDTVLMVPNGHPLASLNQVTFDEIVKYPLILNPKDQAHPGRGYIEHQLQRLGHSYRVAMESSNVELSSVYVEMGLGVSFATISPDLPLIKNRKLGFIRLDHYFDPDYLVIVTRRKRIIASYKKSFIELFLKITTQEIED
ncbi:MAG: LysR family transcriptional regulator [Desulfomonilaceae bacterium]